ncbi:glycoside hydrolase superfamily [Fennellomyces sp. T-0311]|nr:glycoside hydrolase superfamily [Fennellomyces sp. T-0311]
MPLSVLLIWVLLGALCRAQSVPSFAAAPPMGWNTWNKFGCAIDDRLIMDTADTMVAEGYLAAGYKYLNLDDCWQSNNRSSNGTIVVDPVAFPHGIKPVADYVHAKGLKFGIYSSAGRKTCAGRMATLDYEENDAASYAEWEIDYLKYDNCNYDEGVSAQLRFRRMREALLRTGRDIFLSVCTWGVENTWEWAPQIGHSFRTHDDIYNGWQSIVEILQVHAKVVHLGGPGHWADPDMLEIGNGRLSIEESRTHFSLWSAMKAPLILGSSLTNVPRELYAIVTNRQVIAVNQDPLGAPAIRVIHKFDDHDVWAGPLSNDSMAVVVVNYKPYPQNLSVDVVSDLGYQGGTARELWTQVDIHLNKSSILTQTLGPHACAMYKLRLGRFVHNLTEAPTTSTRYEAEALENLVQGLARRKGCELCSGGAYVMAIGNVNRPQTGTLIFRNITVTPGAYTMRIQYLDCFSWSTCGDFFTRRWHLRIRVNDGEPFWVAVKSKRNPVATGQYAIGVVLENVNQIVFDDPFNYGPSIDYIELTPRNEDASHGSNVFELSFMESGDPLATSKLGRVLADFFWELLFILINCGLILKILSMLYKYRHRIWYYRQL